MSGAVLAISDTGPAVTQLQQQLLMLGYRLPRWGADGWYGDETDQALALFAADHGRWKRGGVANASLIAHVAKLAEMQAQPRPVSPLIVDRTRLVSEDDRQRRRPWENITGITLHQTATCYLLDEDRSTVDPAALERAMARVGEIAVHGVALRCGVGVYSNPLNQLVWQAQRVFNDTDVGLEIDGFFAGVEGDPATFWKPKSRPNRQPMRESPAQTQAALALIDFFVEEVARHGGRIRHIHAHRQTSATRRSDPGELIWKTIAIPAMAKHGLDFGFIDIPGPEFFVPAKANRVGDLWTRTAGRPIPRAWDSRATAEY